MAANHGEADLMTVLAFLLDVRHLARAEGRDREVGVKADGEGQERMQAIMRKVRHTIGPSLYIDHVT